MRGRNDAFFGGHCRRRGVEADLREGIVGAKAGVVAVVAQIVKGFVGVLDCDFRNRGIGKESTCDGIEELPAVGVVLMGWQYDKL